MVWVTLNRYTLKEYKHYKKCICSIFNKANKDRWYTGVYQLLELFPMYWCKDDDFEQLKQGKLSLEEYYENHSDLLVTKIKGTLQLIWGLPLDVINTMRTDFDRWNDINNKCYKLSTYDNMYNFCDELRQELSEWHQLNGLYEDEADEATAILLDNTYFSTTSLDPRFQLFNKRQKWFK
jgi:hypothetical protein